MPDELKSPPLIEAILEIKWNLQKATPDTLFDPGYKLASGRLYDRVKEKYSHIQELPITSIPEEITPYQVRHQFRVSKNNWPLVQFGPGIASINFTSPYNWELFKEAITFFMPKLIDAYSNLNPENKEYPLNINSALLRYINGVEWNWEENDTIPFLSDKLHTNFSLPDGISKDDLIVGNPLRLQLQLGYKVEKPIGMAEIRFATGIIGQKRSLIWELIFTSLNDDAPQISDITSFLGWASNAHTLIEKWFKELTKGELYKSFNQ